MAVRKAPGRPSRSNVRATPSAATRSKAKAAPGTKPKAKSPKLAKPAAKAAVKTIAKRPAQPKPTARAKAKPKAKPAARLKVTAKKAAKPKAARKPAVTARAVKARAAAAKPSARKLAAPKAPVSKASAPKPPAAKAAPKKQPPERLVAQQIIDAAQETKAERMLLFDLRGASPITDYVLIASGRSQGHVRGIAGKIEQQLKKSGRHARVVEGFSEGSWVVLDYDVVIVHVFHPETRIYYDLEGLLKSYASEKFAEPEERAADDEGGGP